MTKYDSLLYGLPAYQLNKLQRVQNAAIRLIFQESIYCHVRLLLYDLHWLPAKFWIDFNPFHPEGYFYFRKLFGNFIYFLILFLVGFI